MKPNLHSPRPRFPAGFSLAEILVVVSIIFVLMALSITAMKKVAESTNVKQTRLLLQEMMTIESEYQRTARQRINHYSNSSHPAKQRTRTPIDWTTNKSYSNDDIEQVGANYRYIWGNPSTTWGSGEPPMFLGRVDDPVPGTTAHVNGSIEAFVWATMQLPSCAQIYSRQRADRSLRDGDPEASPVRNPDGFFEVVDSWNTPIRYYLRNLDPDQYPQGSSDPEVQNYSTDSMRFHDSPFFVSAGPDREMGSLATPGNDAWKKAQDNIYSFDLE